MAGNEALILKIKINEKTPQVLIVIKQNLSHSILVSILKNAWETAFVNFRQGKLPDLSSFFSNIL